MTIQGTIRTGLIVVAMYCVLNTCVVAQISPYPYLSAPHMERGVRSLIDAGMIRRAAADVAYLTQIRKHTAVYDVVPFDKSDILKSSGNRAGADREMDAFLRERTNSPFVPLAWMERAVAALEDGEPEAAAGLFATSAKESMVAFEQRRDTFYITMAHKALFWEGATRASLGQFAEARDVFGASIKTDSLGEYAAYSHYAMGQIYERNADVHQAIGSFDLVRTRYPASNVVVASRIREAVNLITLRKPERALDVLTGIDVLLNEKDVDRTVKQVDVDHANEEVALVRAEAYTLRRNYQEALDSCESFITRYPFSPYRWHVHLHAGYNALMLGLLPQSLGHYAVILDSLTDDASVIRQQALLYHSVVLKRSGKIEESLKAFTGLASQSGYPYQSQALIELGQSAYEAKDFDRARKALERAERESRDAATSLRAQLLLGATLIELQQWAKAASAYERAQSIAQEAADEFLPDRQMYLAETRLKRGISLIQAGQVQPAINALTDFLGNHPNDAHRDEATFRTRRPPGA
ncbi:MAG: tetratricopeptide repeat protein, partial [Candidatus Kapabacteria bacterium]|nr:tetratricopeptide repeat protein [Candidatus Kapabacteria bacterium]